MSSPSAAGLQARTPAEQIAKPAPGMAETEGELYIL